MYETELSKKHQTKTVSSQNKLFLRGDNCKTPQDNQLPYCLIPPPGVSLCNKIISNRAFVNSY